MKTDPLLDDGNAIFGICVALLAEVLLVALACGIGLLFLAAF